MRRTIVASLLLLACRPGTTEAPDPDARCAGGDAEACFDHGLTFQFPASGAPDLARASELYDRSCTMGHAWACLQAAGLVLRGGGPPDEARASGYARRACALGHADACTKPPGELGGVMPKAAIRTVVRGHIAEVRACYNAGLARDPELRGRVHLRFTIMPDGSVAEVALTDDLADAADVGRCIAEAARRWKFPAPFGRVIVSYPFVLEPG